MHNCLLFQDLIEKDDRKLEFILNKREKADLIYSFDKRDADKYGLLFHNIPYSCEETGDIEIEYDVSFVGQAKDRLSDIYKCITELNKQCIKAIYYLVGVDDDQKRFDLQDVIYIDSFISYENYIKIVKDSKCILEIMQLGGTGNTIRVPEAIAYNKLLISNNEYLRDNEFYNRDYMLIFSDIRKINMSRFLKTIPNYTEREMITPARFLTDISNDIEKYVEGNSVLKVRENLMLNYYKNSKYAPKVLLGFDVHISEHCNLNCANCNHYSPIAEKAYLDISEYTKDINRLSQLFDGEVDYINLMGGEPLLNKKINEYLEVTRKAFPYGHIRVVTNGILIERMDELFWRCCSDNNIEIAITKYPIGLDYDKVFKISKNKEIEAFAFGSQGEKGKSFMYRFPINPIGDNDPASNYYKCLFANDCVQLKNGKLYTCVVAANANHLKKRFGLNISTSKLNGINIYEAKDAKEILEFLTKPIPFCRYCDFEKYKDFEEDWHISNGNRYEWISFSFSKADFEYLREVDAPIYVYGAGKWARETVRRLKEESIEIKAIIVSDRKNNPEHIDNVNVIELSKDVKPGVCIIAVDGKAKTQIQHLLYEAGFNIVIPLMKL